MISIWQARRLAPRGLEAGEILNIFDLKIWDENNYFRRGSQVNLSNCEKLSSIQLTCFIPSGPTKDRTNLHKRTMQGRAMAERSIGIAEGKIRAGAYLKTATGRINQWLVGDKNLPLAADLILAGGRCCCWPWLKLKGNR